MGLFKKKASLQYDKPRDESISQVFKKGDTMTRLSFFVFGLGNILNKQIVRGAIFLALEILYFVYMIVFDSLWVISSRWAPWNRGRCTTRLWEFTSMHWEIIPCSACSTA